MNSRNQFKKDINKAFTPLKPLLWIIAIGVVTVAVFIYTNMKSNNILICFLSSLYPFIVLLYRVFSYVEYLKRIKEVKTLIMNSMINNEIIQFSVRVDNDIDLLFSKGVETRVIYREFEMIKCIEGISLQERLNDTANQAP